MVRRVKLPESKLKRRRRIRRTRLLLVCLVLGILLIGAVTGLAWLPYVRVHQVAVAGVETIAAETLEDAVSKELEGRKWFIFPKNNIFIYPKKEIANALMRAYPKLSKAEIRVRNFESIEVRIAERHAKALWCGAVPEDTGDCRLMDATGFVYTPVLGVELPSFVRYSGAARTAEGYTADFAPLQYLSAHEFAALSVLVDALNAHNTDAPVISVDVDEHTDVRVSLSNGFILIFALKDVGGDVYERFTLALASEVFAGKTTTDFEYLDLRFGDKLYYKLKNE